jgi:hypothetical protein
LVLPLNRSIQIEPDDFLISIRPTDFTSIEPGQLQ